MKRTFILLSLMLTILYGCKKDDDKSGPSGTTGNNLITSFVFNGTIIPVMGTIDTSTDSITFVLPPGTDPSAMVPTIICSPGASLSPKTGVSQDFSSVVSYTVTSSEGKTRKFYVRGKLTPSTKNAPIPPKALCLYYGYPSLVNGSSGNLANAVSVFSKFDIIVFGDGIDKSTHADHNNTIQIITGLKAANPAIKIYGYVDLGSTQNLSTVQLNAAVDNWQAMGVTGIFGDEFGYDFGVTRTKQNEFINYIHGKSMSVFANAWFIDQALGDNSLLDSRDYYLMESSLIGNGNYTPLSEYKSKADKAYYYMRSKGVGIALVNTAPGSSASATANTTDAFKYAWCGAAMYNFDAFQFTDFWHSAGNNLVYYFPNLSSSYGSQWLQGDWVKQQSSTVLSRSTDTKTISITSNGSNSKGEILP